MLKRKGRGCQFSRRRGRRVQERVTCDSKTISAAEDEDSDSDCNMLLHSIPLLYTFLYF